MKSVRRSALVQGVVLALVLLGLGYLLWQRYHPPALRTYEGKTLDQWIDDLYDPDIRLNRRAAAALLRIGAPAAPALAAELKDKARQQRIEVALVRLGSLAVPSLRERLADDASGEAAAHVLGLIGPRAADAVPDLIAVLNRHSARPTLRSEAAFALGRIGGPPFPPPNGRGQEGTVAALIAALTDSKKEVREQAAEALGWIGPAAREAVPELAAALKNDETTVGIKACQALSFIDDAEAAPALLAAFQNGRPEVAVAAGRALWRLGTKADPVVPALLSLAQAPPLPPHLGGGEVRAASARDLLASFGPRLVPILVKALGDKEAARREAAADVLGRIGPPARAAAPALLHALDDKSSRAALMAAMALAEIDSTRARAAVPLLADALDIHGSALALANIGPDARAAVPALIAVLKLGKKDAGQELLRLNARLALARIGTPAVHALIEALKDKREGVAPLAGEALGWILPPPKEAIPALRQALQNDRAHAGVYASALGQLGPLARPAVPDLVELLTNAANRYAAAAALVRIDPEQAEKAVRPLVKDLQAEDEQQWHAAVLTLAHLGPAAKAAADAAAELLRDRRLTESEITVLGGLWAAAIPALINVLKDPQADIRKRAVLALGQIGPSVRAALTPLMGALSDPDAAVRAGAAQVLQNLGPEASAVVPALIVNLQAPQWEVRAAAAAALGHIEAAAKEARQPLLECLLDPDENVRYAAALSLGRIDPHFTEAAPALRDALSDPSPMVQLAAIDSLSRIEPAVRKETGPLLAALSRNPYPLHVRFRAVEGIIQLLGPEQAKQAVPWLTIELTDVDPESRIFAAHLLAGIDADQTSTIVLALAEALRTPLTDRRTAVLQTLGEFGPKAREAVPEIERQLYEGAPGVRSQAIRTLRAINPARLKQLGID